MFIELRKKNEIEKKEEEILRKQKEKSDYDSFIAAIPKNFVMHLMHPMHIGEECTPPNLKKALINEGEVSIKKMVFYFKGEHPEMLNGSISTSYDALGSLPVYEKYAKVVLNSENKEIIEKTVALIHESNIGLSAVYDELTTLTIKVKSTH
jgi:hypothetical protein